MNKSKTILLNTQNIAIYRNFVLYRKTNTNGLVQTHVEAEIKSCYIN